MEETREGQHALSLATFVAIRAINFADIPLNKCTRRVSFDRSGLQLYEEECNEEEEEGRSTAMK